MLNNLDDIYNLGNISCVLNFDDSIFAAVEKSYLKLITMIEEGESLYGIHTGFGANVTTLVDYRKYSKSQLDLLNYLQVGIGEYFSQSIVRRALKLQILKLAKGYSGIHPTTFKRLCVFANSDYKHAVYEFGSLGASGDLIPMAHAVAPIFENNEIHGPRDILSLVNTNAFMSSYAVELFIKIKKNIDHVFNITAINSLSLLVSEEPYATYAHSINAKYLPSVQKAGEKIIQIRNYLDNNYKLDLINNLSDARIKFNVPLQEKYSIRCASQVLGNILNQLATAENNIFSEALIVADNPLIVSPIEGENRACHGGMFYTAALGSSVDLLMDVIGRASEMLDRQILILMHPSTSHGLPENLGNEAELHLKGLHQLLSSLQQQIRSLAVPSRLMSFSAESNNQDILPCTMAALHNLKKAVEIFDHILLVSHFIAEKAFCLRFEIDIPEYLKVSNFRNYNIPKYI